MRAHRDEGDKACDGADEFTFPRGLSLPETCTLPETCALPETVVRTVILDAQEDYWRQVEDDDGVFDW